MTVGTKEHRNLVTESPIQKKKKKKKKIYLTHIHNAHNYLLGILIIYRDTTFYASCIGL